MLYFGCPRLLAKSTVFPLFTGASGQEYVLTGKNNFQMQRGEDVTVTGMSS